MKGTVVGLRPVRPLKGLPKKETYLIVAFAVKGKTVPHFLFNRHKSFDYPSNGR